MLQLLFLIFPPLVICGDVTLKEIFLESEEAIANNSTEAMMDLLSKYYFTSVKDNSIWYLAQKESEDIFGMPMEMESLQFIEMLLKRMASHYQHCTSLDRGIQRAQCFSDASPILKDTEKGVRWHTDPDMEVGEKAKFGTLYNSVAAMSALLSVVAKANIQHFQNPHERNEKIHRFTHVIFKMISDMQGSNPYDHDIVEFRLDQISPVRICEVTNHFWKEFVGSCETRWTNMAYDKSHKNQVKLRSKVASPRKEVKSEGGEKADETEPTVPDNDESRNTVEDKGIDAATLLGGDMGPTKKRYKTSVVDTTNDKIIYEKYFIADIGSRGTMMDDATREALELRGKEELVVKDGIMKFMNGTFYINMKLLRNTLELLKL